MDQSGYLLSYAYTFDGELERSPRVFYARHEEPLNLSPAGGKRLFAFAT